MTRSPRTTGAALGLLTLVCLAIVAVPVVLIRPFSPQTTSSMALAFTLRHWSPIVTLAGLAAGIILLIRFWQPGRRILARATAVLAVLLLAVAAWGARQNHFEWMFNPLTRPGYVRPAQAGFVAPRDMVLAVDLKGDPVAYPVRQLAYHHVVEDSVGGVPIVATY